MAISKPFFVLGSDGMELFIFTVHFSCEGLHF